MTQLTYAIQPISTVSKNYPELRFELEKKLFSRIEKDLKITKPSTRVFLDYLEVEINSIQEELNYLVHDSSRGLTKEELDLVHQATRQASVSSLVAIELFMELSNK